MEFNMRKNDRFIAILIGLGIWTLILFQIFETNTVIAHHEGHKHDAHKHYNFALSDHIHSSSEISSLRKDMRRLIEKCVIDEQTISC
jgi:hypothetical protein